MSEPIRCADDVLRIPQISAIRSAEQEHQYVLGLNRMLRLVIVHLVAVGTVDQVQCHARDIFRELIRHNCTSFVLVHNHPGGDPPSQGDEEMTEWVRNAGEWLGIPLIAHVLVTATSVHEVDCPSIRKFPA